MESFDINCTVPRERFDSDSFSCGHCGAGSHGLYLADADPPIIEELNLYGDKSEDLFRKA